MEQAYCTEKPRTFLATTELDGFWDKAQPILFLGKWCTSYKNKDLCKTLDCKTLDGSAYLEQEPEEVTHYINQTYQSLLPKLVFWFNKIHSVQYSLEYWDIVLGSFLYIHIQTVYQRYRLLKEAYAQYPSLNTIGLLEASFHVPLNTTEYYDMTVFSNLWNLQQFTQLISLAFKPPIAYRASTFDLEKKIITSLQPEEKIRLPTKIRLSLLWLMIKLWGSKIIVIPCNGFTKKELLKLMFTSLFRILPLLQRDSAQQECAQLHTTVPNIALRNEISTLPASDEFSKLIVVLLVYSIPMSFIENYKTECRISEKYYPYYPKAICGISMVNGETMNLWAARNPNKIINRVGWQPGGAFCILKFHSIEFAERELLRIYIAWGTENRGKVIAAPATHMCKVLAEHQGRLESVFKSNQILWVASDFTKYPFELMRVFGMDYHETLYYEWQAKIISLLHPDVFSQVIMRLRFSNFSDRWQYIQNQFPTLKLHKPENRDSFFEQIWQAKLLLFDNLNTTYSYAFVFNIPSILFWDERIYTVRDDVKIYFDALRDVGIFHSTPESAAAMINKVGNNPFEWWYSKEVQLARKKYCDYFLPTPNDWLKQWKNTMLKVLRLSEAVQK